MRTNSRSSNMSHISIARLCTAAFLFAGLPIADALHHMAVKAPRKQLRRKLDITPLIVTNKCPGDIWPGISTQSGTGPRENGFKLQPGETKNQTVSEDWQGRVWGRTNCTFNKDGTASASGSGKACYSGDCNSQLNCAVGGDVPVSLAEFTLDAGDGNTYYDISLVDGYNVPMAIVLQPLENVTLDGLPPNLTNPSCQGTDGLLAPQGYDPYPEYPKFLSTNTSFALPFEQKVDKNQISKWCPWDLQQTPPNKPGDGVYPYPDDNIQRPQFNPCFSACAKNNKPQDCCTAYDDQTSTFIIPSGAGFEVIFCPGARSTNIIDTGLSKMQALSQKGMANQQALINIEAREKMFQGSSQSSSWWPF
ncbi:hypothetical protein ACEQ8H_006426 [Pleosporales sp. CAS-2024a]